MPTFWIICCRQGCIINNLKMVIHIQTRNSNLNSSPEESEAEKHVQYMPFKISADSDANVSSFFTPYVKVKENSNYSASFRGYPLVGQKISIPNGYTGVVLHERIKPETDKDERKFFVIKDFDSFMYWNWDKVPSKNDSLFKSLSDWIDIAEALHSPITEA